MLSFALLLPLIAVAAAPAWMATRAGHASFVHDTKRDRIVRCAGRDSSFASDVWTFSLSDSTARWQRLETSGPVPAARMRHAAVYDALNDRMLIFGGQSEDGPRDDLWSLSFADSARWERLAPHGEGPGPAESPTLVVDSGRRRCLLLGVRGEAWWLWLDGTTAWERVKTSGRAPAELFGMGAVLDSTGKCAYTFGGDRVGPASLARGSQRDTPHDDLRGLVADPAQLVMSETPRWTRGFPWARRLPPRPPPRASCDVSMAFDERRARVLLYIGSRGDVTVGELWAHFIQGADWHRVGAVCVGFEAGMKILVDPQRDELLVFRGVSALSPPQRVPLQSVMPMP